MQNTSNDIAWGKAPSVDCLAEYSGQLFWPWTIFYPVNYQVASSITESSTYSYNRRSTCNTGTICNTACHPNHQLNPSALGTFTGLGLESWWLWPTARIHVQLLGCDILPDCTVSFPFLSRVPGYQSLSSNLQDSSSLPQGDCSLFQEAMPGIFHSSLLFAVSCIPKLIL